MHPILPRRHTLLSLSPSTATRPAPKRRRQKPPPPDIPAHARALGHLIPVLKTGERDGIEICMSKLSKAHVLEEVDTKGLSIILTHLIESCLRRGEKKSAERGAQLARMYGTSLSRGVYKRLIQSADSTDTSLLWLHRAIADGFEPAISTWNAFLNICSTHSDTSRLRKALREMAIRHTQPDAQTLNILLRDADKGDVDALYAYVHAGMKGERYVGGLFVKRYVELGMIGRAFEIVGEFCGRGVGVCGDALNECVVRLCVQGETEAALCMWREVRRSWDGLSTRARRAVWMRLAYVDRDDIRYARYAKLRVRLEREFTQADMRAVRRKKIYLEGCAERDADLLEKGCAKDVATVLWRWSDGGRGEDVRAYVEDLCGKGRVDMCVVWCVLGDGSVEGLEMCVRVLKSGVVDEKRERVIERGCAEIGRWVGTGGEELRARLEDIVKVREGS